MTPDMTFTWAPRPVTSPGQPQQRILPTWRAVGAPDAPFAAPNPNAPSTVARKVVQKAGIGGLGGLAAGDSETVVVYRTYAPLFFALQMASSGVSAYHGYKRNRGSVGWALGWGLLGGLFPVITVAIAAAQGFGEPKRG